MELLEFNEEDRLWLLPVSERLCDYKHLIDGTLSLYDVMVLYDVAVVNIYNRQVCNNGIR